MAQKSKIPTNPAATARLLENTPSAKITRHIAIVDGVAGKILSGQLNDDATKILGRRKVLAGKSFVRLLFPNLK